MTNANRRSRLTQLERSTSTATADSNVAEAAGLLEAIDIAGLLAVGADPATVADDLATVRRVAADLRSGVLSADERYAWLEPLPNSVLDWFVELGRQLEADGTA
jgi:prophage tail gpP-like protein